MFAQLRKLCFILASKSPRRIEFLKNLELNFEVIGSDYKEEVLSESNIEEICILNAFGKAKNVALKFPDRIVAGFDTIVAIDNTILGKPDNVTSAVKMLKRLSGKKHNVFTAYSIIKNSKEIIFKRIVKTEVYFKELSDAEINWYVSTKEPMDKAGAYAIQGIGAFMIKSIKGSYTNVVGLPLVEFLEDLEKFLKLEND